MDSNLPWLNAKFADRDFSKYAESDALKSKLDSKLLELLSETAFVTNKNVLKKDMDDRFPQADFRLTNGLYIPHCKTNGVSEVSFSAIIDKTNQIYGMIAIPDYSNPVLKRLASIIELLTDENLTKVIKARKKGSQDLAKIFAALLSA